MAKTSPKKFFLQVKAEAKKVTWSNRKETSMTTVTVIALAMFIALFFFCTDKIFSTGVLAVFDGATSIYAIGGVVAVIMAGIIFLLGVGG